MGKSAKKPTRAGGRGDSPRMRAWTAKFLELQNRYPGQYLAYREEWDGDELREPFLVAVGETAEAVSAALAALPPEARTGATITFLRRPGVVYLPPIIKRNLG